MRSITDIARFRSELFLPQLPEECQVNPHVYGAELAYWLGATLARKGIATSYPESEDWGWFIEYTDDSGAEFAVHCCNEDDSGKQWLLSLRRYGRKLFGFDKPPYVLASALIAAIKVILNEDTSISDLKWLYADKPGSK